MAKRNIITNEMKDALSVHEDISDMKEKLDEMWYETLTIGDVVIKTKKL